MLLAIRRTLLENEEGLGKTYEETLISGMYKKVSKGNIAAWSGSVFGEGFNFNLQISPQVLSILMFANPKLVCYKT